MMHRMPLHGCISHRKAVVAFDSLHKQKLPHRPCIYTINACPRHAARFPVQHKLTLHHTITAAAPTPVTTPVLLALQHSIAANPGHFLLSVGGLIACIALAAFLLAAIPSILVHGLLHEC